MNDHWNNPPEDNDSDTCLACGVIGTAQETTDGIVYTCPGCFNTWAVPFDTLDDEQDAGTDEIDLGEPTEET